MSDGFIDGPRMGRYGEIRSMLDGGLKWVNENGEPRKPPKKSKCARCKKSFETKDMFYQIWTLTKEELEKAINEFDIFSLEMRPRILCSGCAEKIRSEGKLDE